jgi:hypothetical protein
MEFSLDPEPEYALKIDGSGGSAFTRSRQYSEFKRLVTLFDVWKVSTEFCFSRVK